MLVAYRPIRQEPFSVLSFVVGWIAGELAFQNIVWQVVATVVFIWFGALDGWAGWLGLAIAVAAGSAWSAWASRAAGPTGVVAAALAEVRSADFPVPDRAGGAHLGPLVAGDQGHPAQGRVRCGSPATSTTGATASAATASTSTGRAWPRPPARPGHGLHPRRGLDDRARSASRASR